MPASSISLLTMRLVSKLPCPGVGGSLFPSSGDLDVMVFPSSVIPTLGLVGRFYSPFTPHVSQVELVICPLEGCLGLQWPPHPSTARWPSVVPAPAPRSLCTILCLMPPSSCATALQMGLHNPHCCLKVGYSNPWS